MGSSLDRYSGIFHDWKCNSCLDSNSDLGSNSASRQNIRNGLACIYVNVNFAVNTADASCINFRREHRLGIFFDETGIFTSCNFNNDVFFQSQNERENSVSLSASVRHLPLLRGDGRLSYQVQQGGAKQQKNDINIL